MTETPGPSHPPRQRRYAPRTRVGCLTCRRRKKKCPGGVTTCRSCIRLNLECEWDTRIHPAAPRSSSAGTGAGSHQAPLPSEPGDDFSDAGFGSRGAPIPRSPTILPASGNTPNQSTLLSYYIYSFVPNISVAHTSTNLFTSVYIPMAFQCPHVLQAILACSAAHLAKGAPDDDDRAELLRVSSRCQIQSLRFLRERISLTGQLQRDPVEAIAIILLLIGLEVQNGAHTGKWMTQLNSVRNVIRQDGGKRVFCKRSWEAEAIYGHFLYHDVMSLIMSGVARIETGELDDEDDDNASIGTTGASPLSLNGAQLPWARFLPREEGGGQDSASVLSLSTDHTSSNAFEAIHPLLGLSKDLFLSIQKIRHVKPVQGAEEEPDFDPYSHKLFCDLEKQITNLRFDLCPLGGSEHDSVDLGARLDLVVLAETYRLAALILLYRRACLREEQIPALARRIISFAERIPRGRAAEAGLTYPLFLAGAELVDEGSIVLCATKLMKIRERVKVMNIQSAEEVLQEVWRDRLNGGEPRGWESILRSWNWVINLG